MSRKSLASPLAVIIAGVILTIMLLTAPNPRTGAVEQNQNSAAQVTEDTSDCVSYPGPDGYIPQRCLDLTTTPQGTASPSPTVAGTTTATAVTPSVTTTASPIPTLPFQQPTTLIRPPPLPPTAGPTAAILAPTAPAPADTLTCTPGEPIMISGEGPPRVAFLLYFGQRAVGGGSVTPNGRFAIPLVVGQERAGTYTVTVRVRGTTQVLHELTCEVPPSPPPTPPSRQPL